MKRFLSTKYSENAFAFAMFVLRLTAGGLIIPHGVDKLQHFGQYSAQFINPFHLGNTVTLGLSIFAELFCGIFIVLGLFTRLAAIPLIINMAVAVIIAHNSDIMGKGQQATLFLGIFVALLFVGPGKFSMDRIIGK